MVRHSKAPRRICHEVMNFERFCQIKKDVAQKGLLSIFNR